MVSISRQARLFHAIVVNVSFIKQYKYTAQSLGVF